MRRSRRSPPIWGLPPTRISKVPSAVCPFQAECGATIHARANTGSSRPHHRSAGAIHGRHDGASLWSLADRPPASPVTIGWQLVRPGSGRVVCEDADDGVESTMRRSGRTSSPADGTLRTRSKTPGSAPALDTAPRSCSTRRDQLTYPANSRKRGAGRRPGPPASSPSSSGASRWRAVVVAIAYGALLGAWSSHTCPFR